MSRVEKICDRLPKFYKAWDRDSALYAIVAVHSDQFDRAEEEIVNLMRAHWVDSSRGSDLDRLGVLVGSKRIGDEDDRRYRARLKRAVTEYEGGGTVAAILEAVRSLIGSRDPDDVRIEENPPTPMVAEFRVMAGATWEAGSISVVDAEPTITLTVEEGGEVSDPIITNTGTGESAKLTGIMKSGQKFILGPNGAELDGKSASKRVEVEKTPTLLRVGSTWKYTESLSALLGVFDSSKFDEHTFTTGIRFVNIKFEWTSLLPAAFEIQIKAKALEGSGITAKDIETFVGSMKAAGIRSMVKIV